MNFPFLDPIEINRVRDAVNADAEFRLASRFFSKDILLVAGDSKCIVKVREGVVTEIELNPTFMNPWSFFIKGGVDAWEKFLRPIPPPLFTDLYGCISRQHFELGGDIEAAFAHFWAVTRMLEIFRALQNDAPAAPAATMQRSERASKIEPVAGRYLHLNVQGTEYRVYFEQNGAGIPLICQHTAASDGRLWRHLLNDEEVTRSFHVIAADLPYHGKSLPPETVEWWTYLGGTNADEFFGAALTPGNGVIVVGRTQSTDFPVTAVQSLG